jgi:hypothetical protein
LIESLGEKAKVEDLDEIVKHLLEQGQLIGAEDAKWADLSKLGASVLIDHLNSLINSESDKRVEKAIEEKSKALGREASTVDDDEEFPF